MFADGHEPTSEETMNLDGNIELANCRVRSAGSKGAPLALIDGDGVNEIMGPRPHAPRSGSPSMTIDQGREIVNQQTWMLPVVSNSASELPAERTLLRVGLACSCPKPRHLGRRGASCIPRILRSQFEHDGSVRHSIWSRGSTTHPRRQLTALSVAFHGCCRLTCVRGIEFIQSPFKSRPDFLQTSPVVYKKKTALGVYQFLEKPRSPAAVNRELQLLSRIFSLAHVENPCSKVDLLKGERKRKRYLLPDERERLIQAMAEPGREWLARIILVDLYTGLRRNELLGLRPEHLDFERNVICVAGAKSELDLGTKTDEDREVYMNSTVSAILADQMTQAKSKGWEYLFTNPVTGTRYKDIKKGFKDVLRDAGIEFWFHDLRRSFATRAGSDPSVGIPALAATLGHKNWQTTMRYTYATDEAKRRVVDAQERAG